MKRALIAIAVVLVLAAIVGFSLKANGRSKGVKVYAEGVARRDIVQVVKATGAIEPLVKVEISSPLIAKIERLYVKEGDWIVKGKPFLDLERAAFEAQRDQWAAQLENARTAVRQSEVSLEDAAIKLARAERLSKQGITTIQDLEAAKLQEVSARLRLEETRQSVRQMQASLNKALDDLSKTRFFAPLTGRVVTLNAEEGEVVVSGTMNNPASVIGTIADLSEILAKVDVDETEIVRVAPGQGATLRVDALPDKEYKGRVVKVGSSGFARTQQPDVTFFKVEILLDEGDESLRPGMSVRAEIDTRAVAAVPAVPIQAVVNRTPLGKDGKAEAGGKDDEVPVVFVVGAGGKVEQRSVQTGISDETHVQITGGLTGKEQVVTGPYRALRDLDSGDTVTVDKAPGPAAKRKAGAKDDDDPDDDDEKAGKS